MDFEKWLEEQDEETQKIVNEGIAGLKSALGSEREARNKLEGELRDAAGKLKDGDELKTQLEQSANELSATNARLKFYESAGGKVKNLKLAFMAAKESNLVGEGGAVDLEKLQKGFPELFEGEQKPAGNIGDGNDDGSQTKKKPDMDAIIRKQAGVIQ